MQNDNEEKQIYLRSNILEGGYNVDEFVELLQSKKGEDAADLDLWTFEELKASVGKHQDNDSDLDSMSPKAVDDLSNRSTNIGTQKSESTQDDINYRMKIDNFEEIIKCEKIELTEFCKYNKLEINLTFPEKHSAGFFSKAYITYLVCTEPAGYKVRRRYSDFEWLKTILNTLYPGYMIPPISKKNYGDRFNEIFISKRMRFLEKFMESLSANPIIKNSQIFFDFLTTETESDFINKKKEYMKIKSPGKLSEIRNIEGEIKCKVSKDSETVADSIKNNLNLNEVLLKKLTTAHKNLFLEMNQVSLRMKEMSELYSQLYFVSNKSNDNITVTDTYKMLSKLMNDWGDAEKKQSILVDVELKEYFRYIKNEFVEFKELIGKMDMNKSAYYKAETKLGLKKEEYFKQGNIAKWEIPAEDLKKYDKNELLRNKDLAFRQMMQKETQHVYTLKENYGYYSFQLLTEFDRLRDLNGLRHKDHVTRVSQNHSDILADLHVMWADLLSYYSDIYDSNTKQGH